MVVVAAGAVELDGGAVVDVVEPGVVVVDVVVLVVGVVVGGKVVVVVLVVVVVALVGGAVAEVDVRLSELLHAATSKAPAIVPATNVTSRIMG